MINESVKFNENNVFIDEGYTVNNVDIYIISFIEDDENYHYIDFIPKETLTVDQVREYAISIVSENFDIY